MKKSISKIEEEDDIFDPVDRGYYAREFLSKAEKKKQEERKKCKHDMFATKCACCGEVLASDVHIRHHTRDENLFTEDPQYKTNYDF